MLRFPILRGKSSDDAQRTHFKTAYSSKMFKAGYLFIFYDVKKLLVCVHFGLLLVFIWFILINGANVEIMIIATEH